MELILTTPTGLRVSHLGRARPLWHIHLRQMRRPLSWLCCRHGRQRGGAESWRRCRPHHRILTDPRACTQADRTGWLLPGFERDARTATELVHTVLERQCRQDGRANGGARGANSDGEGGEGSANGTGPPHCQAGRAGQRSASTDADHTCAGAAFRGRDGATTSAGGGSAPEEEDAAAPEGGSEVGSSGSSRAASAGASGGRQSM